MPDEGLFPELERLLRRAEHELRSAHETLDGYGAPRYLASSFGGNKKLLPLSSRVHWLIDPEKKGRPRWDY